MAVQNSRGDTSFGNRGIAPYLALVEGNRKENKNRQEEGIYENGTEEVAIKRWDTYKT